MSEKPDLSTLFSMLSNNNGENTFSSPEEILFKLMNSSSNNQNTSVKESAFNNLNNTSTAENFNNESCQDNIKNTNETNMPDMETIMKIMKIMKASNQDSPSKELLKSLKPFLNENRKEKVDQYIKILGMTKALEIFNELGDKNK